MVVDSSSGEATRATATTPAAVMFITSLRLIPFEFRPEMFWFIILGLLIFYIYMQKSANAEDTSEAAVLLVFYRFYAKFFCVGT